MPIPYHCDRQALYAPAAGVSFFEGATPDSDAWLSAELARLAYVRSEDGALERHRLQEALARVGLDDVQLFDAPGAQGFFATGARRSALVFRGTEPQELADLATDALALLVPWESRGWVHAGFAQALGRVRRTIDQQLARRRGRLLFTGHSLGAALATLAAALWRPDGLYTFGSPRVGNAEFVTALGEVEAERYQDCCDLVARVPPAGFYRHVGTHRYIDRHGRITTAPGRRRMLVDRAAAHLHYIANYELRSDTVATRALADHAPVNYVSAFTGRA